MENTTGTSTRWKINNSKCSKENMEISFKRITYLDDKERLVADIKITDGKKTIKDIKDIELNLLKLDESLHRLREYGIMLNAKDIGEIVNAIEENYNNIDVNKEGSISLDNIIQFINDYILEKELKPITVNNIGLYCIEVEDFKELFKDSDYYLINLSELRRQLKSKGYTVCNEGRTDKLVKLCKDSNYTRVIAFDKNKLQKENNQDNQDNF